MKESGFDPNALLEITEQNTFSETYNSKTYKGNKVKEERQNFITGILDLLEK